MDEINTRDLIKGHFIADNNIKTHAFSLAQIKNGSSFTIGDRRKTFIPVDQHFNWFQKLMWKWCFGVKVEDYNEE